MHPILRTAAAAIALVMAATAPVLVQTAFAQTGGAQTGGAATTSDLPAGISAEERTDLLAARAALNAIDTMTARFRQTDLSGEVATGRLWVDRPGRLRFEYDPPVPILLVATGSFLIHYDKSMKTTSYVDQDATPAWFLLSEQVRLDDNIRIVGIERAPNRIGVTAVKSSDPDSGSVTLQFARDPVRLTGWLITDPTGNLTRVELIDVSMGAPLNPEIFEFTRPDDN